MPKHIHDVDPVTQASLLAPSPASVALGAVVELEGAYYKTPTNETPQVTAEQTPAEAEIAALKSLADAADTETRVNNMSKREHTLENSEGSDSTEIVRLGTAINSSKHRRDWLKRKAKAAFARSIGIETTTEEQLRELPGRPEPQKVIMVVAVDPARRTELQERYRGFYDKYAGVGKAAQNHRQQRLQLLQADQSAQSPPQAA